MSEHGHSNHHERRQQRQAEQRHIHMRVAIWVVASMIVVVSAWAFLLPTQLRSLQQSWRNDTTRWQVLREESGATSFREAYDGLRAELERIDQRYADEFAGTVADGDGDAGTGRGFLPSFEEESDLEGELELIRARLRSDKAE